MLTLAKTAQYNNYIMIENILDRIEQRLSNGRAKIVLCSLGWGNQTEIFSRIEKLVKAHHPNVEFFAEDTIDVFKKKVLSKSSDKYYCLFLREIFERRDFTVLINLAYGKNNVLLFGTSSFHPIVIDYNRMTTIAGRYESYYLAAHSFAEIHKLMEGIDFQTYLHKGGLLFDDRDDCFKKTLSKIEEDFSSRKVQELRDFFDFLIHHSGENWSERELSLSVNGALSPNTIGKYLDTYVNRFLLYRLECFDFNRMKVVRNKFRFYPYDTSMYGYSKKECVQKIDLLSMTPLIGRAKEEGFDCFFGYFHQKRTDSAGVRRYRDENVGIYVTDGDRSMVFQLNVSGTSEVSENLRRVPIWIDKYVVEYGSKKTVLDKKGIYHVGIEYLLGNDFIWRK